MKRMRVFVLALCAVALAGSVAVAAGEAPPDRVEPLRKKWLSRPEYVKLRDAWKAWAEAHPDDAHAWAQLAKAGSYAGDLCDVTGPWAEKAYQLDPDDADACAELARHRWSLWCGSGPDSPDEAIRLMEHALAVNPDCDDAHVRLWVLRMAKGDRRGGEQELATMLDRGRIPEPLSDYAYNELVGLQPHAILFTNGDNDTYPAVALQAARGFRTDVTVINLSLFTVGWYRRMLHDAPGTAAVAVPNLDEGPDHWDVAVKAVDRIVKTYARAGSARPVYFAVSVPLASYGMHYRTSLEGLVYRVLPGDPAPSADTVLLERNYGSSYRLQSATSPTLDWNQWSALRPLMANYVAGGLELAKARARSGNVVGASREMNDLMPIVVFHRYEHAFEWLKQWRDFDPSSKDLERWTNQLSESGGR